MAALATSFTPVVPAAVIPAAPAHLLPWQQRAVVHSGELAIARGLRLVGRGVCRVRGHEGAPVFIVSSASRPGHSHFVWVEHGRIFCRCEARSLGHRLTCAHAQFVRLLLVAEHAAATSVPPVATAAPVEPEPEPPTPGGPSGSTPPAKRAARRRRCPTCAGMADPDEIAQLGECLQCLQMRADRERAEQVERERSAEWAEDERRRFEEERADRLPCWACGAPATAETAHGLYCDACVSLAPTVLRAKVAARQKRITAELKKQLKAETARRIIAREKKRERAHTPSEASPRTDRAARRVGAQAKTLATVD